MKENIFSNPLVIYILYQYVKDRVSRMQSQACLGYAEAPPMFEA